MAGDAEDFKRVSQGVLEDEFCIMEQIITIAGWVLASVMIGVLAGFFLGRGGYMSRERQLAKLEREASFNALLTLLSSAEQLSTDVDSHNAEIEKVGKSVGGLQLSGEMAVMQNSLLGQITAIVSANQRLETDLVYTKYRLETQAQEMDRTRVEARTDALSGVGNRKAFDETISYLFAAHSKQSEPFSLILCDVDHFKWINDTHGHVAGDAVVTHIGATLKQLVRPGDFVGRFGGDEFAILLPRTELAAAQEVSESVLCGLSRSNFDIGSARQRIAVTFSMGIATVRQNDNAETLLARADQAMYRSKQGGRNQVSREEPTQPAAAAENVLAG